MNDETKKNEDLNKVEELTKKNEEYLNGWKRERADFLNYKKEEIERMSNLIKYSNQDLILNILPILDNIYLAESHIPEELKKNNWTEGFLQIQNQMIDFLKKEGIEEIKTIGEKFDPNTMEAVGEAENSGERVSAQSGVVVEEVQKGYTMHEKLIRPAKVKISK